MTRDTDAARRIDPRAKLLQVALFVFILFVVTDVFLKILYLISFVFQLIYFRRYKDALRWTMIILILTLFSQIKILGHTEILTIISTVSNFIITFIPSVLLGSLFINTTDATEIVSAFSAMKLPRQMIIGLAVTLRFMATIPFELSCIRQAMAVRNIQLSLKNLLINPFLTIEYLLVPLLIRSGSVSDELSMSALTRAVDYPCKKTSLIDMRLRKSDYLYMMYTVIIGIGAGIWSL